MTKRIERIWVDNSDPERSHAAPLITLPKRRTPWDRLGNSVFWPVAIALFLHRIFILAVNGSVTDDFSTVYYALRRFLDGVPVYNETYYFVDPHYLYSPGATFLLSPLGMIEPFSAARMGFVIANALAVVIALGICTHIVGFSLRSFVWPLAICVAFLTEAVRNTLIFSNINGILLLLLSVFLALLLMDRRWAAGIVLGFAILVKPQFAPLLFLPFVKLQWQTLVSAVVVPVAFNLIGWKTVPGAADYLHRTMPYLGEVRDYANSSMPGMSTYFLMPSAYEKFWFFAFAALIIAGLIALLRYRYSDPEMWVTTTSGLLFAGVFFLSSLGQMYYSMLLFPLLVTVALRRSVMHTWPAWLAAYCFLSPDDWRSDVAIDASRWAALLKPTFGWGLIVVVICVTAIMWTFLERRNRGVAASSQGNTKGRWDVEERDSSAIPIKEGRHRG